MYYNQKCHLCFQVWRLQGTGDVLGEDTQSGGGASNFERESGQSFVQVTGIASRQCHIDQVGLSVSESLKAWKD